MLAEEGEHLAPAIHCLLGPVEWPVPIENAVAGSIVAVERGLPGNPVSALVSWLFLGGAVVTSKKQRRFRRRLGCPMPTTSQFQRRPGRTEFVPARLALGDAGPGVEILGRGGSARLRPLVLADGLAEIAPLHAPVELGDRVLFHPFRSGFVASDDER